MPHPATVTPSPTANPLPMPVAAILVHTSVISAHVLPSYCRITLTDSPVSSHSSPAVASVGASVPTE